MWKHVARPIQFCLVVDDFGVKYTNQEDIDHLINIPFPTSNPIPSSGLATQTGHPKYGARVQYTKEPNTTAALNAQDAKKYKKFSVHYCTMPEPSTPPCFPPSALLPPNIQHPPTKQWRA